MQPITAMAIMEVAFIIWFGVLMLVPLFTLSTRENDDDHS